MKANFGRVLVVAVLVGAALLAGCSSPYFRRAARAVGEEAAYTALKASLLSSGVRSADHMVDAVRLVASRQDYGGALAAFAIALEEHNVGGADKLTSAQAIILLRQAAPAVRQASPKIAIALTSFCDYAASNN